MKREWLRGVNTPEDSRPPIFAQACLATAAGAWRNLGGWWVKERYPPKETP